MNTSPSLIATIKKKISDLLKIERHWVSKVVKYIGIGFLCILIGFPLYIFTVNINLFGLYGDMPDTHEVENPENDLSSELISADSVSLGRYFRLNRSQVSYEDLSKDLVNTLLLSEDHRFYDHAGLDFVAFIRVAKGLITFNPAGGGSTITQQIAKNLYTRNPDPNKDFDGYIARLGRYPKRIVEKTKEWIIAVDLEKNFTKEEIIAMYLNTSAFSNNAYGIKVAAETYFKKSPDSLNIQESAVLIGMLQAVNRFNPVQNPEKSLAKRNEVLRKLLDHGYIKTRGEYDSIAALPIELNFSVEDQNTGLAPYFKNVIRDYLMQFCKERGIDLWNSGLKIYTTIDSRLQKYAEEAVDEHMRSLQGQFEKEWNGRNPWIDDSTKREIPNYINKEIRHLNYYKALIKKYGANSDSVKILISLKKPMTVFSYRGERDTLFSTFDSLDYYKRFLQTGFMSMDPTTGHIKAWVGGVSFKFFQFDHVRQGKRQPGSTFKPFVYGLAMESGYSPCQPMKDISPSFKLSGGGTWNPPNASPPYYGSGETYTLRQAMARSLNSITAQMMLALGPENVVEFAHRVGIKSKLDAVPSLCLGVSDVSLFELVGAYSTYVNGGIYTEPYFITRIEDKNGNVIENFVPKTRQAVNEQTAYKMVYMLRGGVEEEGGTSSGIGRELKTEGNEIGGKTGTTNNASDGWYVGITHNLVSGGWVGGDERSIRFPSWDFGAGGKSARPIWSKYMLKVYADPSTGIKKGQFKRPASGLDLQLDCNRYVSESGDTLQVEVKPFDIN